MIAVAVLWVCGKLLSFPHIHSSCGRVFITGLYSARGGRELVARGFCFLLLLFRARRLRLCITQPFGRRLNLFEGKLVAAVDQLRLAIE